MDATLACGIGALFAGASAGFCIAKGTVEALARRQRAAKAISQEQIERAAWVLRNGCRPLFPLAKPLLEVPLVRDAAHEAVMALRERGMLSDVRAITSLALLAGATAFALVLATTRSAWAAGAVTTCLYACAIARCRNLGERRRAELVDGVPASLRSMSVCFRAGLSLMQTMRQTGQEIGGALGALFERAARELETGAPASEVLEGFRHRAKVPELAFVAVALDVQHQSGGSLSHVLDVARESLESELELRRSLRVQTAQAKLSARIVTLMPFLLIALFSTVSEGFLNPFFESWAGMGLLLMALSMQAAGVLLVRRMLHIEER